MRRPKMRPYSKACVAITKRGLTIYGNTEVFAALAEWCDAIASADPEDHEECHFAWHLFSPFATRSKLWMLCDKATDRIVRRANKPGGRDFELTLMSVSAKDLVRLSQYQRKGTLPDDWNGQDWSQDDFINRAAVGAAVSKSKRRRVPR